MLGYVLVEVLCRSETGQGTRFWTLVHCTTLWYSDAQGLNRRTKCLPHTLQSAVLWLLLFPFCIFCFLLPTRPRAPVLRSAFEFTVRCSSSTTLFPMSCLYSALGFETRLISLAVLFVEWEQTVSQGRPHQLSYGKVCGLPPRRPLLAPLLPALRPFWLTSCIPSLLDPWGCRMSAQPAGEEEWLSSFFFFLLIHRYCKIFCIRISCILSMELLTRYVANQNKKKITVEPQNTFGQSDHL